MDIDEINHRSVVIAVIELWERNRCLWDLADTKRYCRETRNEAYQSLLSVYRKMDPSATLENLKRKLQNMKAAYKREHKKVKSCMSMTGTEDAHVPKLWYYEHLRFLDSGDNTRNNRDSLGVESDYNDIQQKSKTSNGDNISVVSQQSTQEKVLVQQQTQESPSTCTKEAGQQQLVLDDVTSPLTSKECEWEVIANSIGLQLKNLDTQQQDFAQKLISDVIFYGKRGKLSDSTTILLEPLDPSHLGHPKYSDSLGTRNWNSGVPSPQSLSYSPYTSSSCRSSPSIIAPQLDYRFSSATPLKYLKQPRAPPALLPLEKTLHHTYVEQSPMSINVTSSTENKYEEIIISDNEDSND
ncbi:uncharacterized protein LOC126315258 isoform X1 [Schistocerca gregaria]|uniref:uncharacterized protein LOC126315258 isoform X1 n=1 Tax=Schistocerca gregaria TaxID=7010 RepID=UPI00211E8D02|nr:uncharacterized protein LOC126315258 isoform X1 [Schistocerca gregaria]